MRDRRKNLALESVLTGVFLRFASLPIMPLMPRAICSSLKSVGGGPRALNPMPSGRVGSNSKTPAGRASKLGGAANKGVAGERSELAKSIFAHMAQ